MKLETSKLDFKLTFVVVI